MASIDTIAPDGRRLPAGSKAPKGARYRLRYRTPEGNSRTETFPRRFDAEQRMTEVEAAKLSGGFVDRSAGAVKLGDWFEQWVTTRRTRRGQPLRPRTVVLYRHLFALHIAPTFGAVRVRDISPAGVRAWHANITGSVQPAKCYRLLRAMLNTAVVDEVIV